MWGVAVMFPLQPSQRTFLDGEVNSFLIWCMAEPTVEAKVHSGACAYSRHCKRRAYTFELLAALGTHVGLAG